MNESMVRNMNCSELKREIEYRQWNEMDFPLDTIDDILDTVNNKAYEDGHTDGYDQGIRVGEDEGRRLAIQEIEKDESNLPELPEENDLSPEAFMTAKVRRDNNE